MLRQQRSPSTLPRQSAPPPDRGPLPGGPGNQAVLDDRGLGGDADVPSHELDGPMAGLLLDALPADEAGLLAADHLGNPAVRDWLAARPDDALTDVADPVLDVLWPRGVGVEVAAESAGALPIELALAARGRIQRDDGGALGVDLWTEAGVSAMVAASLLLEDAFGRRDGAHAEAGGALGFAVHWRADALPRSPARLVRAALSGQPAAEVADEVVAIALDAAPDLSLAATASASASAPAPALEQVDQLGPVTHLVRPFLRELSMLAEAGGAHAVTLTALAGGAVELTAELSAGGAAGLAAELTALGDLLAPDEVSRLDGVLREGARATLHVALRDASTGELGDGSLALAWERGSDALSVTDSALITAPGQLAGLLGVGRDDAALPAFQRTLDHEIPARRVVTDAPLAATVGAILSRVAGAVPGLQHLAELRLTATLTAPPEAIRAALDAGLDATGQGPAAVADALLAAQGGQAAPAWATAHAAALEAGLARMPAPTPARLVGRFLVGAGGKAAAGAGPARGSVTARATAGLVLDRPLTTDQLSELLALLGEAPRTGGSPDAGQSERLA